VALPVQLRPYTDYIWQRNAFEIGRGVGMEGQRQYPGSDYSVPYWNARQYGFITAGASQLLAWKTLGSCEVVVVPDCDLVEQTGCDDDEGCYFSDPTAGTTLCWDKGDLVDGADCSSASAMCLPGLDCFLDPGSSAPYTYHCRAYCDDTHPCSTGTCQETDAILGVKVCF
jgi:hypothetical protein